MSSTMTAELAATCSALGHYDEKTKKYYADENTLETVKDLIRYLRRDDENHEMRRQLGETKVLQSDLLPLLKSYWENTELFDVLLRLIVNLTTPPLILWNGEVPTHKNVRNYFMQIEDHLQDYKLAFADDALWSVLSTRMNNILEKDYVERGDENGMIIERILVLVRNILYVPADPINERRPDNDANNHDQVAWSMHQSGILDVILYIASSHQEQSYHMQILEILYHLLREQNPMELGKTDMTRNHAEKVKDESELMVIRHKESIQKQQKTKYTGARHSRFGGTFVVKTMKSISDNDLIYHKPISGLNALDFDINKQKTRASRNRLPFHMESAERRSAFSIRLFLKELCIEFLNSAYNTIMFNVKSLLIRAKSQMNDSTYYLWALRFFMEFNRAYKFEVKLICETMSVQSFHYVQQHMENYFDMMQSDKKQLRLWSRRLHIALLTYRELLLTLCAMDKSPDETVRESSKVIKSNIFYVLEYRELILTLLVTYDEFKMSDQYLKDLMETQHIFLKLFEQFCKNGTVIVQQKSKGRKKKKKQTKEFEEPSTTRNLEENWDEASQQISSILETNANIPTDVVPFDATSEVPIDEQKSDTMIDIQRKLRNGEYENAIGLLRAAREVWPENDYFGNNSMSPEEEFSALRDIFMADLKVEEHQTVQQPIYNENDEEEDEDEGGEVRFSESNVKFEDFVQRLGHPKIVRAASLALMDFEENSINTNHCIVKLLHRIAFDCKMYVMMFQVSLFITFRKIYAMKVMPQFKELIRFATYILRQFFHVNETNKKVYMEALFWKSSKDAFDVEYGYGSYKEKSAAASRAWTEEEEDEVRRLFVEHKEKQLDDDVVNWILENLIDNTRTRRGLLNKMKEMYLLTDYKAPKKSRSTAHLPQNWSEEEEEQLQELYEQFRDAMDPLGCIMSRLNVNRPKNRIVEKLLVLGLIQDRKEVKKKRIKGQSRKKSGRTDAFSESEGSDDDILRHSFTTEPLYGEGGGNVIKEKPKKKRIEIKISKKRLIEIILEVKEAGLNEALDWLKESFSDAVEDYEEDAEEGIPLVPIMDYAVDAMENETFQKLISEMGLVKPSDEQENYWRIPNHLSLEVMKLHVELLTKALEGNLELPDNEEEIIQTNYETIQENQESSSEDEDIFEKLKNASTTRNNIENEEIFKSKGNGRKRRISSSEEDDVNIENALELTEDKLKKSTTAKKNMNVAKKPKRRMLSSEEDEIEDVLELAEKKLKKSKTVKKKANSAKKSRSRMLSSGEDEIEDVLESAEQKLKKKKSGTTEKKQQEKRVAKKGKKDLEYKSKEFISDDDSSCDDEESTRKLQEHYEKMLQNNLSEPKNDKSHEKRSGSSTEAELDKENKESVSNIQKKSRKMMSDSDD